MSYDKMITLNPWEVTPDPWCNFIANQDCNSKPPMHETATITTLPINNILLMEQYGNSHDHSIINSL